MEVERLKAGERMAIARAEAAEAREAYLLSTSTKAKEYKEKGLTLTSEEARSEVLASEVQRLRAELARSAADADAAIAGEVAKNAIEGRSVSSCMMSAVMRPMRSRTRRFMARRRWFRLCEKDQTQVGGL